MINTFKTFLLRKELKGTEFEILIFIPGLLDGGVGPIPPGLPNSSVKEYTTEIFCSLRAVLIICAL